MEASYPRLVCEQSRADHPRLVNYQPGWGARAGLLARTGEVEAADEADERAIGLEADPAARCFPQRRGAELRGRAVGPTGST